MYSSRAIYRAGLDRAEIVMGFAMECNQMLMNIINFLIDITRKNKWGKKTLIEVRVGFELATSWSIAQYTSPLSHQAHYTNEVLRPYYIQ